MDASDGRFSNSMAAFEHLQRPLSGQRRQLNGLEVHGRSASLEPQRLPMTVRYDYCMTSYFADNCALTSASAELEAEEYYVINLCALPRVCTCALLCMHIQYPQHVYLRQGKIDTSCTDHHRDLPPRPAFLVDVSAPS